MKNPFDKAVFLFVVGGVLLAVFLFLFDSLQGHWTVRLANGEYGLTAVKSWICLCLGNVRVRVDFLNYVALAMLIVGAALGLWRIRKRGMR